MKYLLRFKADSVVRPHKIKRKVMLPKYNGEEQKLTMENQ